MLQQQRLMDKRDVLKKRKNGALLVLYAVREIINGGEDKCRKPKQLSPSAPTSWMAPLRKVAIGRKPSNVPVQKVCRALGSAKVKPKIEVARRTTYCADDVTVTTQQCFRLAGHRDYPTLRRVQITCYCFPGLL